jgi:lipopolysaccharide export system protein LptC
VQPFVFKAMNLRQQDGQGRPAWQITSPEARYDSSRRVAQARDIKGTIYAAGKPLYRLTATSGIVLNDGELIQLEGRASLARLGPQPLRVETRRLRWYPRQQRIELDLRPRASQAELELNADRAVILLDRDKLELRGNPLLLRRPGPQKPQSAPLELRVAEADWWLNSGQLRAPGPVRAQRQLAAGQPPQTLTSPLLQGNTVSQQLVLQAPVRFGDPQHKATLLAGETEIDLRRQLVHSSRPFRGRVDQLQLAGEGFELRNEQTLAVIDRGCELDQPGEQLRSQRCQWNWTTQAIEASGQVSLRRQANNQLTRAEQLNGQLGADGLAVFTSPASRVHTQLQLPPSGAKPAKRQAHKPAIEL